MTAGRQVLVDELVEAGGVELAEREVGRVGKVDDDEVEGLAEALASQVAEQVEEQRHQHQHQAQQDVLP